MKLIDWRKFNPSNPVHVKHVVAKMNAFMANPARVYEQIPAKVREFTTTADTSQWSSAVNAIEAFQTDVGDFDTGWMAAFDEVDLRGTNRDSIDLIDVSSGLTFAQVAEGERAQIYGVSGTKSTISADLYGGGVGFSRKWWMNEEWYKIEEQARDFRYKSENQRATLMYGLITAVSDSITFDTNDQTTLGAAASELIVDNEASLPGITDSTTFLLYHHPSLKQRVAAALRAVLSYQPGQTELVYNIQAISTPKCGNGYLGWLVAPGLKNKYLRKMDLTLMADEDITMFAEDVVGWTYYGGSINSAQVRRINKS